MFHLPKDLISYIYEFDGTYREVYNNVMISLRKYNMETMEKLTLKYSHLENVSFSITRNLNEYSNIIFKKRLRTDDGAYFIIY